MAKSINNKGKRDTGRAARIKDTAQLVGVSTSEVQKVLRAERNNETVEMVYLEITERYHLLLDEVKRIIPFNKIA